MPITGVVASEICGDGSLSDIEECDDDFTADGDGCSMNCLVEALGLALPGNGSTLATHSDREQLFLQAGRTAVELCKRYYGEGDASVLPRNIANFKAFENAMTLDIAMGAKTFFDPVSTSR